MSRLASLIDLYTRRRTVIVTVAICLAFDVLALTRVFYPPVFGWLIEYRVFEAVTVLALSQILLIAVQIANPVRTPRLENERDVERQTIEFLSQHGEAKQIHLLSAGLSSRIPLLHEIVKHRNAPGLSILVQDPDRHLDLIDAGRLRTQLQLISRGDLASQGGLEIRKSGVPASIRGIIVCDRFGQPLWAAASWYVYRAAPGRTEIKGHDNPAFVLDGTRADDRPALLWLNERFLIAWNDAADNIAYTNRP
jgi:hypothetical protein